MRLCVEKKNRTEENWVHGSRPRGQLRIRFGPRDVVGGWTGFFFFFLSSLRRRAYKNAVCIIRAHIYCTRGSRVGGAEVFPPSTTGKGYILYAKGGVNFFFFQYTFSRTYMCVVIACIISLCVCIDVCVCVCTRTYRLYIVRTSDRPSVNNKFGFSGNDQWARTHIHTYYIYKYSRTFARGASIMPLLRCKQRARYSSTYILYYNLYTMKRISYWKGKIAERRKKTALVQDPKTDTDLTVFTILFFSPRSQALFSYILI